MCWLTFKGILYIKIIPKSTKYRYCCSMMQDIKIKAAENLSCGDLFQRAPAWGAFLKKLPHDRFSADEIIKLIFLFFIYFSALRVNQSGFFPLIASFLVSYNLFRNGMLT